MNPSSSTADGRIDQFRRQPESAEAAVAHREAVADQPARRARIEVLDLLRGLAAVAVTFYHFTTGNHDFLPDGWLKSMGQGGAYGVEVFFVISGFVIPYSLMAGRYQRNLDFGRFVLKRVSRLDPPYLATIAVTIGVAWLAQFVPRYGVPFNGVSLTTLAMHLGYLNPFFDRSWLNPVFWTLAIEFQFYLTLGLFYPALTSRAHITSWLMLVVTTAAAFAFPDTRFLPFWTPLFALGILTFQFLSGGLGRNHFLVVLGVAGTLCAGLISTTTAAVGVATALAVAFIRVRVSPPFAFLGAISYSLYLMHVPIGGKVIRLGSKLPDSTIIHLAVLLTAFAITLAASWMMYRFVELPSQRFSSAIQYTARRRRNATPAACTSQAAAAQ